ncbi:MAG: thioredoxin [Verrucomicrobiia bacterium]
MLAMLFPVAIGALLGAGLGYFGQCTSGTCPLTSNWRRGALFGAALGGVFALGTGRDSNLFGAKTADSPNILHLTESDFDAQVLQADRPVLVDFYAPWCGPCKMIAPTISKLADAYVGRAHVAKLNVDNAPKIAARYGVQGIPTILFFHQGKVVDTVVGLAPEEQLRARLERLTGVAAVPPQQNVASAF